MSYTIKDISKYHCTGCAACVNACPTSAISMKENEEGFLYPYIDEEKCISCGLCYKKCPVNEFDGFAKTEPEVYAVMGVDKHRATASSGGVFSHIAEYVFENGGIVYGVANKTPFELEFVGAENMDELEKIKASKYFQAVVGDVYKRIKEQLENGRMVLFGACPCQVAGLVNYLGKEYENLITADLVCHGVPSHKAIKKYASEICDINKIDALKFRDKVQFKWSSNITVNRNDGETIRIPYEKSIFYRAFDKGMLMRESCYNCRFAKIQRIGDFTLADYWHISEFAPSMNDYNGTSCIFLNTEKAHKIYSKIEKNTKRSQKMPLNTAIKYNTHLKAPVHRHQGRKDFYKEIEERGFSKTVEKMMNNEHFDVGVIGYWYATNYGSVITYYSLYKAIEDLGYNAVIIDRPDKMKDGEPQTVFSRKFMGKFANVSQSYGAGEQNKYNNLCDKFVVGSDQVWTRDAIMYTGYRFFLDFVSDDKTKVAYAPSFGQDRFDVLPETRRNVSYLLSRFDGISIRENTGVELCKKTFNVDAVQTVDPIFLNKKELYDQIAEHSNLAIKKPYVLSYILDPDEDKRRSLIYTKKKLGLELYNILDGRYNTFDRNNEKLNLPNTIKDVNVEQWVRLFKDAEYVVTDSHHGFAMAVLFNKPVICIMNKERGGSRFTSLLGWLGMLDRLVDKTDDLSKKQYLFEPYDYSSVNSVIEEKRQESIEWLKNNLAKEKNGPASLYDFVNGRIKELEGRIWSLKNENQMLRQKMAEMEEKSK